jgi:hypothetical protein
MPWLSAAAHETNAVSLQPTNGAQSVSGEHFDEWRMSGIPDRFQDRSFQVGWRRARIPQRAMKDAAADARRAEIGVLLFGFENDHPQSGFCGSDSAQQSGNSAANYDQVGDGLKLKQG